MNGASQRKFNSSNAAWRIIIKQQLSEIIKKMQAIRLPIVNCLFEIFYSPQILSFPSSQTFTNSVVTDLGLSIGKPNALDQQSAASTPNARLTANKTV